jgi:hypothetical protein
MNSAPELPIKSNCSLHEMGRELSFARFEYAMSRQTK